MTIIDGDMVSKVCQFKDNLLQSVFKGIKVYAYLDSLLCATAKIIGSTHYCISLAVHGSKGFWPFLVVMLASFANVKISLYSLLFNSIKVYAYLDSLVQ